jgi:hypothetical protein
MSWLAPYAYWASICAVVGVALHSEFLDRDATDDPFGDGANGNDPFIAPEHLKTLFHATETTRGGQ